MRNYTLIDRLIMCNKPNAGLDQSKLRTSPADSVTNQEALTEIETQKVIKMMRVNHTGEVCAQALYQGQAIATSTIGMQDKMQQAAVEEQDHLNWCKHRLDDLGGTPSKLAPLWYISSLLIGFVAGVAGDRWSLGFLQETEQQVGKHLEEHLSRLPVNDLKSKAIISQMHQDELEHATYAKQAGAANLPDFIKNLMTCAAKVMTTIAAKI